MAEWIKVVILGVIEGLTEFLPISSTGHLIVSSSLLDLDQRLRTTFEICIQIGAVFAVLAYYRDDLLWQVRSVLNNAAVRRLWLGIVIAFLPFALVGMLTRGWIKANLFTPSVVAWSLIAGGVVLLVVENIQKRRGVEAVASEPDVRPVAVSRRQAVIIGLAQLVALVPGVSRSAASIVGGMASGLSRRSATEFSFLLAIPTLGGATTVELLGSLSTIDSADVGYLVLGSVVSAVVAWVAVRWLLRYISRNSFVPFGYYRIAAGVIILLLVAAQILPAGTL